MSVVVYRSRVGIGVAVILFVVAAILYVGAFNTDIPAVGLTVLGLLILTVGFFYFAIQYTITGNQLIAECRPFYKKSLDIASITKIKEAEGYELAPALAFKRLLVLTRSGSYVIVAPQNTAEFIRELKYRNQDIRVEVDI